MEEKVTKCLEAVGEAFKELIASADNEAELIGLVAMFMGGIKETFDKAVDEGIDELKKREEEGN